MGVSGRVCNRRVRNDSHGVESMALLENPPLKRLSGCSLNGRELSRWLVVDVFLVMLVLDRNNF